MAKVKKPRKKKKPVKKSVVCRFNGEKFDYLRRKEMKYWKDIVLWIMELGGEKDTLAHNIAFEIVTRQKNGVLCD